MGKRKKSKISTLLLVCAVICFGIVVLQSFCKEQNKTYKGQIIELSNKTELANVEDNRSDQIIENLGYTVSYNKKWHIPNWVAYELTAEETLGEEPRYDKFVADPQAGGVVISTNDYKNSGYDRGHMAPAADMKWNKQAMIESFYLSNICPQNHNLNAGIWKTLEEKARSWAQEYGRIYIACGPLVDDEYQTIGYNEIAVPSAFYKVILKNCEEGIETIGFVFKNDAGRKALSSYVVSVDSVESLTHIDFFYNLPDSIENNVEKTYSLQSWRL